MENIYTRENWTQDGTLKVKVGQYVADDVIEELRDSVPPATYKSSCFQPGEAYTHSVDYIALYMTFVIDNGMWKYIGLCPKGSNQPQPEMDYSILNESRQGLKSMKLFNIIKQHGGFEEKTPSFYLHDMTDDDIIGVLPEDDLQKLMKMHVSDRNNYAIQHGFKINRGDTMEIIPLKDWTWIGVIERNHNLPNDEYGKTRIGKLKRERGDAKRRDGAHYYQWSDTGKWGSPRAEEFYMRRTQNDIANQRRQRYGDDAVYKMNESIEGLDKFAAPTDVTRFTNNLINKLYKVSQPYTSHRFRDNDWRHLKTFVEILRNVEGVEELIPVGTGPYKQSQEGAYKEYTLDITTTLGSKIGGFIRCHFCGSQENPWDVYDMTVNFYRDNENNNEINENNMSKIVLKEEDLMTLVNESVKKVINEAIQNGELDEGWFGDKWNQIKTGANTLAQGGDMSLKDRFGAAKKNWTSQGELNNINSLSAQLSKFVEDGQLNPNMTIAQLIGGKINGNKFGRMSAMAANRRSQISKRGGQANEEE